MLIQLPNGNWIDPKYLIRVRMLPREQGALGTVYPSRVNLNFSPAHTGGMFEQVEFESDEDAERFRDEMAAKCNAAALEQPQP